MEETVKEQINKIIGEYSSTDYTMSLIKAKDQYFEITGSINDDDDDFESRMNLFNEWYIFNYCPEEETSPFIERYLQKNPIDEIVATGLKMVNYSLFEYVKNSFRGKIVLQDILHGKKVVLENKIGDVGLMPKDIFIGRVLNIKNQNFLLNGLCTLPGEVKSTLSKESKKVRKKADLSEEISFLLILESLKTKWKRYGHVETNKIFVFKK
ncbi:MAG: hypothetical protein HOE90_13875 [Bacteriovoracaceae bacterium]|jgi:hypothetical protein|nr:hypothetical protein [Bacteriovoracaceae bacterium]